MNYEFAGVFVIVVSAKVQKPAYPCNSFRWWAWKILRAFTFFYVGFIKILRIFFPFLHVFFAARPLSIAHSGDAGAQWLSRRFNAS